ncbi:MAG: ATP-binding protein [Flavobacteriales bacterium]|nr:ATP-binding protein [Flavobacteriales bacterium]
MKSDRYISSIEVQNFKCFENFTMEEIGQINLVVGTNNVGKSTLLESLLMTQGHLDAVTNLHFAFTRRIGNEFNLPDLSKSIPYFVKDKEKREFGINLKRVNGVEEKIGFQLLKKSEIFHQPNLNNLLQLKYGNSQKFRSEEFLVCKFQGDGLDILGLLEENPASLGHQYMPYIGSQIFYEYDLVTFYSEFVQVDKNTKDQFIEDVKCIIPELIDLEVSTGFTSNFPNLGVRLKNTNQLIPLGMFGDGSIRLVRILLEMYAVKDSGLLLIDEVDSGIHSGKLEEFWHKLLTVAFKLGIQLFATTHNTASIQSLAKVAGQQELFSSTSERIKHFVLEKDKQGKTRSYSYSFDQLEHALEHGNNIMGR